MYLSDSLDDDLHPHIHKWVPTVLLLIQIIRLLRKQNDTLSAMAQNNARGKRGEK